MTTVHEEKRPTLSANPSVPSVVRRRGRPYRLPADPTPISDPSPALGHRLAWLLGASRIYASDPQIARRATFIGALQDVGVAADTTKLSRWESGRVAVPMSVVRGYETVLGLPPGQLVVGASGFVQGAARTHHRSDLPPENPTEAHLRLDELFEKVLAGRAPGHTWLELCDHLTRQEHLYLLPDTWRQISDLLASELGCSSGLAYFARFEALGMLVANPTSRRHAVRAIGSVVTHPASVFMVHPMVLLQEVDDDQAWDLLARLLRGTPSTLRSGAAWAVAGKIARGGLTDVDLEGVEAIVLEMLERSQSRLERLDALSVARALPPESQARLEQQADEKAQASLGLAYRNAEIRDAHRARAVSSKIADAAQNNTAIDYLVGQDQMLHRLVREALFHVDHSRRNQAALLLAASPYRAQLGDPLLALAAREKQTTAVVATSALFQIAAEGQRAALLECGLSDRRPAVRATALMSLGQVVGHLDDAEGGRLRDVLTQPGPAALKSAALHVLGMGEAAECLDELAAEGPHAEAARWWLGRQPIVEPMSRG